MLKLDHAMFPAETRARVPSRVPSKDLRSCDLSARSVGSSASGAAELPSGAGQTNSHSRQRTSSQGRRDDQEHPGEFDYGG